MVVTGGVGLAVGRQPSKLIYTGSIPVPRSRFAPVMLSILRLARGTFIGSIRRDGRLLNLILNPRFSESIPPDQQSGGDVQLQTGEVQLGKMGNVFLVATFGLMLALRRHLSI
jgi:hypothetical protein